MPRFKNRYGETIITSKDGAMLRAKAPLVTVISENEKLRIALLAAELAFVMAEKGNNLEAVKKRITDIYTKQQPKGKSK